MRILEYLVTAEDIPVTLGGFLRRKGYPKGLLAAFRVQDCVWVNGCPRRLLDPIQPGEKVKVCLREHGCALCPNPALALPILYEDEDILVVNKPANMLVHPAGLGINDSVGNFFAAHCPDCVFRPIGRLDRNTTGACLIAKNQLAAAILTQHVDKYYYAIAEGRVEAKSGTINAPLERISGQRIVQRVSAAGKPSCTAYTVLWQDDALSFLRLQLLTGRTHQIRVHMQHLGHPLIGDALYGGECTEICRQALHCGELRFSHPISHQFLCILAPLPEDMLQVLSSHGNFSLQ